MLTARQAANELHHLADFVFNNPPPGSSFADLGAVRATVQSHLVFLREPAAPPDNLTAIRHALQGAGVEFIPAKGGKRVCVRLRKG
jgi:hypothetical protein